ncbi:SNF2L with a SWI SNF2 like ATpase and a Myb domain [Cryptosporidium sp. chipmunk genotype I]|uniref:SNF2L with a SWI SNF2 like ATpase and a Myb domain n=1 Tax=Cryptosporidium sp. chipmunk genotype I TaxID=1280935 RepID=UPI003519FB13|nr:SNF2L with a SWI SNF2 like ATpase and a Myb domain [Cryptosporidium sp. chipmunk genotype I]
MSNLVEEANTNNPGLILGQMKSAEKNKHSEENSSNKDFNENKIQIDGFNTENTNFCLNNDLILANNFDKVLKALEQSELEVKLKKLLETTNQYSYLLSGESKNSKHLESKSKSGSNGRQHFISEKEEDDILIKEVEDDSFQNEDGEINYSIEKVTEQPECITGKMKFYQLEGLNWMFQLYKHNINGILADEMGLGKTLQTISILGFLKSTFKVEGPHIILTPRSTLDNWFFELKRWCPSLRVVKLHGDRQLRDEIFSTLLYPGSKVCPSTEYLNESNELAEDEEKYAELYINSEDKPTFANFEYTDGDLHYNVCLTTFEMAIKEKWRLQKISWKYCILDEAHRIKNEKSLLSEVVRLLKSKNRLLITGTPLQNNLKELWSLLNFLMPNLFSSSEDFESLFDFSKLDSDDQQKCVIKTLHQILRPFMLRRLKADVERDLPPKRELYVYVGLSKLQKKIYSELLTRNLDVLNSSSSNKTQMLNLLMQLRKTCNHPYLFDGVEPGPPYVEGFHMVEASGKMVLLHKLLPKLFSQGSRVLLFSQMTRLLDIIDDYLRWRGYPYCRIDGSTPGIERQERIDIFNKEGSDKLIFLLSTRAGGIGINLATADVVILFDSDFNPQMDLQAMDRAHRIGQKKPVTVYRFVTEKTVEERIVERAAKKLKLDSLIIQQGLISNASHSAPDNRELHEMIQFGAQEVYHTRDLSSVTDEDIDTILAAAQERTNEMNAKMKKLSSELDLQNLRLDGGIRTSMHPEIKDDELKSNEDPKIRDTSVIQTDITWFDLGERKTKWKLETSSNNTSVKKQSKPKLNGWRAQVGGGYDHQFFNVKRLDELEEIEKKWNEYLKENELQQKNNSNDAVCAKLQNFNEDSLEDIFSVPPELKELNESQLVRLLDVAEEHMDVSIDKSSWPKKKLLSRAKELFSTGFVLPRCNFKEALTDLRLMFNDGRAWNMNIPCAIQRTKTKTTKGKNSKNNHTPIVFTDLMKREMMELISQGFPSWTKGDFQRFCRAAEIYGSDLHSIADLMENKSFEEVSRYYSVFLKKYRELPNGERIMGRIKMTEEIQNWFSDANNAIKYIVREQVKKNKLKKLSLENISLPFKIKSTSNKFESFSHLQDNALLIAMYKLGVQSYNDVSISFKYLLNSITSVNSLYYSHYSVEFITERCNEISKAAINYYKKCFPKHIKSNKLTISRSNLQKKQARNSNRTSSSDNKKKARIQDTESDNTDDQYNSEDISEIDYEDQEEEFDGCDEQGQHNSRKKRSVNTQKIKKCSKRKRFN